MALRNLLVCITSAGGKNDLPCVVLHSPSREIALHAARSILAALRPCGSSRTERHILPAVDPGRHATSFDYERASTSLMVDLSQSEVARAAAVDWLAPIAPTRHVQGARRSIVMHCADLLSWAHQNALKKIIETSQSNTFFILTTSQATALQGAIISRAVVIRCPTNETAISRSQPHPQSQHALVSPLVPASAPLPVPLLADATNGASCLESDLDKAIKLCVIKALTARSPAAASKAAKEAAYALSKMYNGATAPLFLKSVLNAIMTHDSTSRHTDARWWDTISDIMNVDLQVSSHRTPTGRGSTLTVALHRALLASCARQITRQQI